MKTDGKVIVESPEGKRYIIIGSDAVVHDEKGKTPYVNLSCKSFALAIPLREIKRYANGNRFKSNMKG